MPAGPRGGGRSLGREKHLGVGWGGAEGCSQGPSQAAHLVLTGSGSSYLHLHSAQRLKHRVCTMILIHSGWMPKTKAAERHLHSAVTPGPGPRPSSLQTLPLLPSGPETPRGALLRLSPYCVGRQALNLGFSIKDIGQVPSFRRFRAGVVGIQRTSDMPHSSHVMRR